MAVSKKSITKPAAPKAKAVKAPKSAAAPAGKMVTALRVAKNTSLAKNFSGLGH
ncbi:MAG: hypothetical protein WBY53_16215 [Acidobacteriaceae bacterium]